MTGATASDVLNEAYERFRRTGPEWGESRLTNHGPMAVEVLVRRGYGDAVTRWTDRYLQRLDAMPAAGVEITDRTWSDALGNGRIGDWTAYFERQVQERPWQALLATWWPRLIPGLLAGATHGVIRVGHAVRSLRAGSETTPAMLVELAHGLAFWAARSRPLPLPAAPAGSLDPGPALDRLPRIPDQAGTIAERFGQFGAVPGLAGSVAALRPATDPEQARQRLTDLVTAATLRYLTHGHGQPVLLVHAATAPNAVLHILPVLPLDQWEAGLSAAWGASSALFAAYAPAAEAPWDRLPAAPSGPDALIDTLEQAVRHGDEHVIKFTDTAAEVHTRTGSRDALAAAEHIRALIPPTH